MDKAVDFGAGYGSGEWEPIWEGWNCNWRGLHMLHGITPPSWDIGDQVVHAGIPGILFPSLRHASGINLVIFNQLLDGTAPRKVEVHDPDGQLPKNLGSWS